MLNILLVFAGGGLGAAARYGVGRWCQTETGAAFPFATLIVNAAGCLLIGSLMAYFEAHKHEAAQVFLVTGILGGFTTFSAFGYETLRLMQGSHWNLALLNIGANLCLGLLAVWLGRLAAAAALN